MDKIKIKIYIENLYADIECHLEDLGSAIADRDGWRERERESRESVQSTCIDDYNDDTVKIKEFKRKNVKN